jgi:excisionase family DNA binding protein
MMRHQRPDYAPSNPVEAPSISSPRDEGRYPEPLTVRIPAAIRLTGIGRSKLYELIKAGEIETVKIGASTLIPVDSLRRLIDSHRR